MKIHEFQAEKLFSEFGIPIVQGVVCQSAEEAKEAFRLFGKSPVVIKAQVHSGGRGKAGGVKVATTEAEVIQKAGEILQLLFQGLPVKHLLIVPKINIRNELYLSMTIDRNTKSVLVITSREGGVDIETVAKVYPEKIHRFPVDTLLGMPSFVARDIAMTLFEDPYLIKQAVSIIQRMYLLMNQKDASLIEINPLVVNSSNRLVALDAKMIFDDNALFRHKELEELFELSEEEKKEMMAKEKGFSYVQMDGQIGCMVNGAGLAMTTMDVIKLHGGEPANFLDIGGSSNPQKVTDAMHLLTTDPNIKVILINIFGGITRCDDVANGIVEAFKSLEFTIPVVIRLAGTNAQAGREILANSGFMSEETMDEAIYKAVEISQSK
ncbi:MAG: ADP-forming succinate--CoA ligase subunit beta [Bacteroidales bacterium]